MEISIKILQKKLCYLLIIAYPLFYLGIGNRYPWAFLGKKGVSIGMIVFFILTVVFIASGLLIRFENTPPEKLRFIFKINLILAICFILIYDIIQYHHFKNFGYQNPVLLYLTDLLFMFILIRTSNKSSNYFKLISFFVISHTVFSIFYFPLALERSDMLLAIMNSLHQFTNNLDPYQHTISNIGIPPYFPATILSFIPTYFLNLDPRIIGLFYTIIFLYLINSKISELESVNQFAIYLVFLNPYWIMRHDLYFQLFLIEITLLYLYNLSNYYKIILLGITLATSQFAIILFPFLCLDSTKSINKNIKDAILSIIIAIIIIYGFAHNNLNNFISAVTLHREYLSPYNSDITFGLSPILHFAKNQISLYFIQVFGCLFILAFALYQFIIKKFHDYKFYIACSTICYFYFMITNYFLETYLYIPLLLTIALSNSKKIDQ